jgi:putative spermidine/putrescine transport system permease protein
MAQVAAIAEATALSAMEDGIPSRVVVAKRRGARWWRLAVLVPVAVYFLVPLYAGLRYSLAYNGSGWSLQAYTGLFSQQGFGSSIWLSAQLGVVTTVVTLAIMVPTTVYVHLRVPHLRRLMDFITALPIVIPPVVIMIGVLNVAPPRLKSTPFLLALEYVVLAVPFAYRALDAGVRALDLRTLTDASRSLGSNALATLWRVIVPNLRVAILSATVLTLALVLGEYTMAALDQYSTFPYWIVLFEQSNSHVSVAACFFSLALTWVVLVCISIFGKARRQEVVI